MAGISKQDADLDFSSVGRIIAALMNPVSADPGSPGVGEMWFNTSDGRLKVRGTTETIALATLDDVTAGSITSALWNAQSVVVAVTDDSPVPLVLGSNTVLGRRATGDIAAVSFANLLTDLEAVGITAADLQGSSLATVLARGNHTGTQLSSTISDFNTAVDARAQTLIDALVGDAPGLLDTLGEIADALNDDADFATTLTAQVATKPGKFAANYGNNALTTFTVPHNLGTTDVIVKVRVNATGEYIGTAVDVTDANNVSVSVNTVYPTDGLRIVVIG